MSLKLYILTGEVGSGKTTTLMEWAKGRNDVHALLTPRVSDGRIFKTLPDGEGWAMMTSVPNDDDIKVGRYRFSRASFDRANNYLSIVKLHPLDWLIVDEFGKLECREGGLWPGIKSCLFRYKNTKVHIILVVRSSLKDQVAGLLSEYEPIFISKEDVNSIF